MVTVSGSLCEIRPLDPGRVSSLPRTEVTVRGKEGFSLLEIVISMALTGLGVLCLAGLLKVLGNVEAQDSWDTKALFCAQERMEELRFAFAIGNGKSGNGEEVLSDGSYRGLVTRWTVKPSPVLDSLFEVDVECAYSWKGSRKTVRLSSLVFKSH
jgi:hypothetical protein